MSRVHEAMAYELGPEPEPDDIDGRMPAVVTWSDGEIFYLVASGELTVDWLLRIAGSLYGCDARGGGAARRVRR